MELKRGYKQTEVGVIPEEWDVVELSAVTTQIGDGLHGTPLYCTNGGYFFINGNNLSEGRIVVTNETQSVERPEFIKHRKPLGDRSILMSINGTIGNLALFDEEPVTLGKSVAFINVSPRVSKSFIYHMLRAPKVKQQFFGGLTGSTIGNLGLATIRGTKIPLPSTEDEQRAIATALSDVDELLGGLDRLIAKKRDLKQAAMQQLLTGQTRLPGFHGEWEVKRLGDVADMGSGGTPPSSVPNFYDGDIPWASISDMTKGGKSILSTDRNLTRAGFANSAAQMFPAGTILYAMYASLGECSIAGISLCSSQAILGIRPKNKLSGEYLYYFLTSLKGIVKTLGQQGTQANLNKGMVQDFRLSLPPLPEQTAIASVLTEMDGELAVLTQRQEKTRALKQAMMQELLTGKTRLI